MFARRVVHPIVRMGQAAQSIAAGNLSSRVQEGANLHNEVGALVRNFNDMAARIDALHYEFGAEGARAHRRAAGR